MSFYTSVLQRKSDILLRGYQDGKRIQRKIAYRPYLFVPSQKHTEWKTLSGKYVDKIVFENTWDARDFQRRYEGVSGFEVYGMTNWVYPFINDEYNGPIDVKFNQIRIGYIDIEVMADGEFELPTTARKAITAITLRHRGKNLVFSHLCKFEPTNDDTKFFYCPDESTMLRKFIEVWQKLDLDAITGWNIEGYDIPYIVNRIVNVLGINDVNKLSPWGYLDKKRVIVRGQEMEIHIPAGIAVLDYMEMYKKYRYQPRESYSLEFICQEELKIGKLDYSEYASLHELMVKNPQKYIEYNIIDCERVNQLDDKLKYFNLLFTVAYTAHINYNDAFATTRPWDAIIHSYLMERKIVVPIMNPTGSVNQIVGGFVKDPTPNRYKWVVSFDVTSLYPHLIMMFNISPETFLTVLSGFDPEACLAGALDKAELRSKLEGEAACITASGAVYDTSFTGFLAALMEEFFDKRAEYNKAKKEYDKQKEGCKNPEDKLQLENLYQEFDAKQNALKILLNGAYGALANAYYRWFDPRLAESITMTGQYVIQMIERSLNKKLAEITGIERDYIIAIDTDSNYMCLDAVVEKLFPGLSKHETTKKLDEFCKTVLEQTINNTFEGIKIQMNATRQKLSMKRESIADNGVWRGKKNYILNLYSKENVFYDEPKIEYKGIEVVKSSTPRAAKDIMKEGIKLIMQSDELTFQEYITGLREKFRQLPYDEIAFPRGVSHLHKWHSRGSIYIKGTPIHVRGSLVYNNYISKIETTGNALQEIVEGDKIKFAYLQMPNPVLENVIATPGDLPKELGLHEYLDRDMQFEKAVIGPLKSLTDAVGWHLEPVASLEDLFI